MRGGQAARSMICGERRKGNFQTNKRPASRGGTFTQGWTRRALFQFNLTANVQFACDPVNRDEDAMKT